MPEIIDLDSRALPDEVVDGWRRIVRVGLAGPADARIYTPDELGFNRLTLASGSTLGAWVDVLGYRYLTAFVRVAGTISPNWQAFLNGSALSYGQSYFSATIGQGPSMSTTAPIAISNQAGNMSGWAGSGALAVSAMVSITGGGTSATGEVMLLCVP